MTFTANNTGGEYKHKLSASEMPSHSHNVIVQDNNEQARIHLVAGKAGTYGEPTRGVSNVPTSNLITSSVGSSSSHNNVQPYITVYFWRRTA